MAAAKDQRHLLHWVACGPPLSLGRREATQREKREREVRERERES